MTQVSNSMTFEISSLAQLTPQQRQMFLDSLTPENQQTLKYMWTLWARHEQLPPPGNWHTWIYNAGRGAGKTRAAAEYIRSLACGKTPLGGGSHRRIAFVGETAADARDVMVEGVSGIMAVHPKAFRPKYEPSKRRLTWPNGAVGSLYNATEPDQLRGPQFDTAWCDELAKWRYAQETWDMLQFGLRLGTNPKQIVTTTPRPISLYRKLLADSANPENGIVVTRGTTYDNRLNLAPQFFQTIVKTYEGTRLGRQELSAEVLDDVPGSLWTRASIDEKRIKSPDLLPRMKRIVVAIDPATKASRDDEKTSETGIIVAGLGEDGLGYILDDLTCRESPQGWARRAMAGFDLHQADAIVVEINQGGAMVELVIRAERAAVPIRTVRATRGKHVRAEPISALYEQRRICHVGSLPDLEDQMMTFTQYGPVGDAGSDRVDALVWALTDLFPRLIERTPTEADEDPTWGRGQGGWMSG